MNIVFLTYGLSKNNMHLMPWRYVLEIAKGMMNSGNNVTVVSDGSQEHAPFPTCLPPVRMVKGPFLKDNPLYQACIRESKPDVIYFPVSRRSAISGRISPFEGIPHIAYFPSTWYQPGVTLPLCRKLPFVDAITYAFESLVPGTWLVRALKKKRVLGVATVTDYTADQFIRCDWPRNRTGVFPPGVDSRETGGNSSEIYMRYADKIGGRKYILFMGPSKAIRGIYFLLKAFDRAASMLNEVLLVCLIRKDTGQEGQRFQAALNYLKNRHQVIVIEEKLEKKDVMAFIAGSHAVALPFLLVPSEVPLSVIEALSLGKPVLISETGGTSCFVGKAGIVVPPNDIKALSKGIVHVCSDTELHATLSREARELIARQSNWGQVAQDYVRFTEQVLRDSSS